MTKGKGGRGNKNPYRETHIRVPIPIKEHVERIVKDFRRGVESGSIIVVGDYLYSQGVLVEEIDWEQVVKACDRFIDENSLTPFLHTRNNVNFCRFRKWAENQKSTVNKKE